MYGADLNEAVRLDPAHVAEISLYKTGLFKIRDGDVAGGAADMIAAKRAITPRVLTPVVMPGQRAP
jgi:hypothetical protein